MALFKGSGVAMVTPFSENGVNFKALEQLIEYLIEGNSGAIFVHGTTGEPNTQNDTERREVINFTIKQVRSRLPVFVGTGSNNTAHAKQLSLEAQDLGADGVLVVTPYYNKCTQNGIYLHYKAVAEDLSIPVIAYNVPTRTMVNISPETMLKLGEIKNLRAIKEASGDIDQLQPAAHAMAKAGIEMYIGDDSLTMVGILLGAKGLVSVAANCIPAQMAKLCNYCQNKEYEKARELQFALIPLMKALFCEVNPIPVKKALQLIGIDVGKPRLPLTEMEQHNIENLKTALDAALKL